jgi:hypothetical protein
MLCKGSVGFVLLVATSVAADPWRVTVETVDGNEVTGTVDIAGLKLETDLGTVDLDPALVGSIAFSNGVASVRLRDRQTLTGTLSLTTWKIASTIGNFDIAGDKVKRVSDFRRADGAPPDGKPPAEPGKKPDPVAPAPGAELTPEASGKDAMTLLGRPVMSPDGAKIYALLADGPRFASFVADTLALEASLEVPAGSAAMSLAADGAVAWVVGGGTATLVDIPTFRVRSSFAVEHVLADVVSIDHELALATTRHKLVVLDARTSAASGERDIEGPLAPLPGQKRIYSRTGCFTWEVNAANPGGVRIALERFEIREELDLTPTRDGRFGLSEKGVLYRIGRSPLAPVLRAAELAPHTACLSLREKLILGTEAGFLKIYSHDTFELTSSRKLGMAAWSILADEAKGVMYVFGVQTLKTPAPKSGKPRVSPVGTWHRFRIP